MKKHLLNKLPFAPATIAVLLGIATTAYSGVPSMDVTVFDANSKVAFKGPMSANATFATQNLHPGHYVVQFNAKSSGAKNNQYLLVVSAGKKKVIADAVSGEKLTGGGAAMKIEVGPGSKITGQVVNEQDVVRGDGANSKMIDGKLYVWVANELGSNRGGHWVEQGSAPARNILAWRTEDIQKRIDRGGEGSMLTYSDHYGLFTHY